MESADLLSVSVTVLLVAVCWVAIPGLIAGWMLREHGRSYAAGFALGAVCGPVGVLAALALILFGGRGVGDARPRAYRVHYAVPGVGQLHVSTVWTLAGVATFLCMWALGGLVHAWYTGRPGAPHAEGRTPTAAAPRAPDTAHEGGAPATPQGQPAQGVVASGANVQPPQKSLTGSALPPPSPLSPQTARPAADRPLTTGAGLPSQPPPADAGDARQETAQPVSAPPAPPAMRRGDAPPGPTQNPPATSRAGAVSEVMQALLSRGHRAHPSVSGDESTATLTLSGATLTREVGTQVLGGKKTRDSIKAAGIRIVVIVNGRESWTFML